MRLSEEEVTKLYRIRRTVFQMLRDRNYRVLDSEVNMSKQELKAKFGENMNRKDLTIQTTHKDDPSDKIYVFFRDDAKLGVSTIKSIKDLIFTEGVYRAIIVVQNELKSKARSELNLFSQVRIEAFLEDELLVNVTEHVLVPEHQVLTNAEKKDLLLTYTVKETQLPRMLVTDPVAKYYGLKRGQVCRIIRHSETAGIYVTYRIVV